MAGSYRHIVNSDNKFIGCDLIENLGDACSALQDCYAIIKELGGTHARIYRAKVTIHKQLFPNEKFPFSYHEYWEES